MWQEEAGIQIKNLRKLARQKCRTARKQIDKEMDHLLMMKGVCPPLLILFGFLGWFYHIALWPLLFLVLSSYCYAIDRYLALWDAYDELLVLRNQVPELFKCRKQKRFLLLAADLDQKLNRYYG